MPALIPLLALLALGLCIANAWKNTVPLWPSVFVVTVVLLMLSWR